MPIYEKIQSISNICDEETNRKVLQVSADLNNCRSRIDANVDEQRKYRQVIAKLNNKVLEYRKRAAETTAHLSTLSTATQNNKTSDISPDHFSPQNLFLLNRWGDNMITSEELGTNKSLLSSTTDLEANQLKNDVYVEFITEQLREEQVRNDTLEDINDMLREQAELAMQANQSLREDLCKVNDELGKVLAERDTERDFTRHKEQRNQQSLDAQQKHLIVIWIAFNRLRRQVKELRTETENDLDRQKTEFIRCANNMEKAIICSEMKRQELISSNQTVEDTENILKKYEDAVVRNIKMEHEQSELNRRISQLEISVKRANEAKIAAQDNLQKIQQIPELSETPGRRARSASPGRMTPYFDLIYLIRSSLQKRDSEIRSLEWSRKENEQKISSLEVQVTRCEDARKFAELSAADMKKECEKLKRENEDWERKYKRLSDRLQRLDFEKTETENAIVRLQEQISSLNDAHLLSIDEIMKKHGVDYERQRNQFDSEVRELISENSERLARIKNELEKCKTELENVRQALRSTLADYGTEQRKNNEKDEIILEYQRIEKNLRSELSTWTKKFEDKEINFIQLERKCEEQEETLKFFEQSVTELKDMKISILNENTALNDEISSLRGQLMDNNEILMQQKETEQELNKKIAGLLSKMGENDKIALDMRNSWTEVQLQLDSTKHQLYAAQKQILASKEEFENSIREISILNADKAMLVSEKQKQYEEFLITKNLVSDLQKHIALLEENTKTCLLRENADRDTIERLTSGEKNLRNRLKKSESEIDSLKEELLQKDGKYKKKIDDLMDQIDQTKESFKKELEQINGGHDRQMKRLVKEKEIVENKLIESEKQIMQLAGKLKHEETKAAEHKVMLDEMNDTTRDEVFELKQQLQQAHLLYNSLVEEFHSEKIKAKDELELIEQKLAKEVKMHIEKDRDLEKERNELNAKIDCLDTELNVQKKISRELEIDLEDAQNTIKVQQENFDREKQQLREKIKSSESSIKQIRLEQETLISRCEDLNKVLLATEDRLIRKTERTNDIEKELRQAEDQIHAHEMRESSIKDKLATVERELHEFKTQYDYMRSSLHGASQEISALNDSLSEAKREISVLKVKLNDQEILVTKRDSDIDRLKNENKRIELELADKTSESITLSAQIKQFEKSQQKILKELEDEREKNLRNGTLIESMKTENEQLSRDLTLMKDLMAKKVASGQTVLNDVVENYRTAERARVEVLREKESLLGEITALKSKLEMQMARQYDSEQKLKECETIRNEQFYKLCHVENVAKKAISFAKAQSFGGELDTKLSEINLSPTSSAMPQIRSISSHPLLSTHIDETGGDFSLNNQSLTSSIEVTFKFLKNRIDELEKEKNDLSSSLLRLKTSSEKSIEDSKETLIKTDQLRRHVVDLEDENRTLSSQLASSRQLLISQEETLRARDHEYRSLKTRIISADLHTREREAQIGALKEEILSLKHELSTFQNEDKEWRRLQSAWEEERNYLQSLQKNTDNHLQKCRSELDSFSIANEKLQLRLNESERIQTKNQQRCFELEETVQKYQRTLENLQASESHLKIEMDSLKKAKVDGAEDKVEQLQRDLEHCQSKLRSNEMEKNGLKNELEETRNRLLSASQKLSALKQMNEEITLELNRLRERIIVLEKYENDNRLLENEMRHELERLRTEKLVLINDIDEMKRRIQKGDVERREFDAYKARLERERAALKSHVEALELNKQRTESALRKITTERQALDKSLIAMEKENMELYRNCSHLQDQIAQLEKENSGKRVEEMANRIHSLEVQLHRCNQEKHQLECVREEREQAFEQRIKMLEGKNISLKEHLDIERKRRRDYVERATAHDRGIREIRTVLDESIASLHRIAIEAPAKQRRRTDGALRSRPLSVPRTLHT